MARSCLGRLFSCLVLVVADHGESRTETLFFIHEFHEVYQKQELTVLQETMQHNMIHWDILAIDCKNLVFSTNIIFEDCFIQIQDYQMNAREERVN